jgi:hypothetical protein
MIIAVTAFNPSSSRVTRVNAIQMADKEMVGASTESFLSEGKVYDPLDMLKLHDRAPTVFPHPKWLRESELKHCRIAMLASIGAFTAQWGLAIPGYTPVASGDPTENLNQFVLDWPFGFTQILFSIALIEGTSFPGEFWFGKGDREAGDLGYDPLGFFKNKTDAQKEQMQLKELKNGRLAMIAMAAYTAEHWIPGSVPLIPGKF